MFDVFENANTQNEVTIFCHCTNTALQAPRKMSIKKHILKLLTTRKVDDERIRRRRESRRRREARKLRRSQSRTSAKTKLSTHIRRKGKEATRYQYTEVIVGDNNGPFVGKLKKSSLVVHLES